MTGKTLATVYTAHATGAVILTSSQAEADRIDRLAAELELTVTVRVVEPRAIGRSAYLQMIDTEYEI